MKEDTFYAVIWLERDGELISVDSRPSDALAIALRLDCPIYVDETVLKSSKSVSAVVEATTAKRFATGSRTSTMRIWAAIRCKPPRHDATDRNSHYME